MKHLKCGGEIIIHWYNFNFRWVEYFCVKCHQSVPLIEVNKEWRMNVYK